MAKHLTPTDGPLGQDLFPGYGDSMTPTPAQANGILP